MNVSYRACIVAITMSMAAAPAMGFDQGEHFTARCTHVVDGDTLMVEVDGREVTVDLAGVDAPELDQDWGRKAQILLRSMARHQEVSVRVVAMADDVPKVRVEARGQDLSTIMARSGLAWSCDVSPDAELEDLCRQAREARVGLWSDEHPVKPADFRAEV